MSPKRTPLIIALLCLALLVPFAMPPDASRAANRHPVPPVEIDSAPAVKISPDLLPNPSEMSVQSGLLNVNEPVRAIVQTNGMTNAALELFTAAHGGRVLRHFSRFKASAVELPVEELSVLAELPGVKYVSKDRKTRKLGHVSLTTGADAGRTQSNSGGS